VVFRGRAARRLLFEGAGLDRVRQLHDEGDVDVGGEERTLDLLDDLLDVALGESGLPLELVEAAPEGRTEVVEYHLPEIGGRRGKALFVGGRGIHLGRWIGC